MNKEELAAELYELIVNKGRWRGRPPTDNVMGNSYEEMPKWMQELWDLKAVEFAAQSRFKLEDS